jgi:hypothetical protein
MGVSKNSVPLNPMVLLIIIPKINGYFIGNIPYFQTNPYMGKPATIQENWDISETFFDSWANQLVKGQLFLLCQLPLLNIWRYHPFSHSY